MDAWVRRSYSDPPTEPGRPTTVWYDPERPGEFALSKPGGTFGASLKLLPVAGFVGAVALILWWTSSR
jgi:hypothetical protein